MSVSSNLLILLAAPSKQQSVPVTLCPLPLVSRPQPPGAETLRKCQ